MCCCCFCCSCCCSCCCCCCCCCCSTGRSSRRLSCVGSPGNVTDQLHGQGEGTDLLCKCLPSRRIGLSRVGLNPNPRRPRCDERADASSNVDTDLIGTSGKPPEQSHARTEESRPNWLSEQDSYTLHKPARHRFRRRRVVVGGLLQQWHADLVDLSNLKMTTTVRPFSSR